MSATSRCLLAFLLTGFALADTRRSERVLRRILIVVGALGVGALPLLVATLGTEMEYSYEVLALTVCGLALLRPAFWLASPRVLTALDASRSRHNNVAARSCLGSKCGTTRSKHRPARRRNI